MNTTPTVHARYIGSFEEWRMLFDSIEHVEIKVGLIHSLNESEFTRELFGDTYDKVICSVALYLFDLADRYGKRDVHSEDKIARMAFRVLVNRFFKKSKPQNGGVQWSFWKALVTYENGKLMEKLFWFFRRRETTGDEDIGFDTRPFENIFSSGKLFPSQEKSDKEADYHASVIRAFWMEFINVVYHDQSPIRADQDGGQASLDRLWVKELTSVKMRVRVLEYLDHYGELWNFFQSRIGRPPGYESRGIDPEVMDWLKTHALKNEVPLVRIHMTPQSLEQAVLGHSPAAFLVALHEIGLREYYRLWPKSP